MGKKKAKNPITIANDMLYLNTFGPIYTEYNKQVRNRVVFSAANIWNKDGLLDKDGLWDRVAVLISGLCVVHCIGTMVFVALLSSAGGMLLDPLVHEIGLGIAIALGIFTLGRGVMDHGYIMPAAVGGLGLGMMMGAITLGHEGGHGGAEIIFTVLGVGVLALAHDLNYRATH